MNSYSEDEESVSSVCSERDESIGSRHSHSDDEQKKRIAIIGAGVAGISAARVLMTHPIQAEITIFEATGKLGGVWSQNYEGFGLQTPSALFEFPDMRNPFCKDTDFPSGSLMARYIEKYAETHHVTEKVRFHKLLMKLKCVTDGKLNGKDNEVFWETQFSDTRTGQKETLKFDYVIICTGVYNTLNRFLPTYQDEKYFKGVKLHSADFRDSEIVRGKHAIVIGYGKSAFDCSMLCARSGALSTTLLFREAHWPVPRKLLGFIPFEYATFNRLGSMLLLPRYPKKQTKFKNRNKFSVEALFVLIEQALHYFPRALSSVWWLLSWILSLQLGLWGCLKPTKDFISDFWCGHGVLPHPKFYSMIHEGRILAKKGEITNLHEKSATIKNGETGEFESLPADVLVFGTGFGINWLPFIKVFQDYLEDGLWLYRNILHPDIPGVAFIGSNVTTFTNITTPGIQTRWLAEIWFSDDVSLPSKQKMVDEINIQKSWKRSAMPYAGGSRAFMVQTHQIHYYDELLEDLGIPKLRKGSLLKELLDPYRSRDYEDVITGNYKNAKPIIFEKL